MLYQDFVYNIKDRRERSFDFVGGVGVQEDVFEPGCFSSAIRCCLYICIMQSVK